MNWTHCHVGYTKTMGTVTPFAKEILSQLKWGIMQRCPEKEAYPRAVEAGTPKRSKNHVTCHTTAFKWRRQRSIDCIPVTAYPNTAYPGQRWSIPLCGIPILRRTHPCVQEAQWVCVKEGTVPKQAGQFACLISLRVLAWKEWTREHRRMHYSSHTLTNLDSYVEKVGYRDC